MINDKRIFIKEALGNKKKYLSYRMDLMLFKLIISILVFIATYFLFLDLVLSVLCSVLTFFILTLINKINIDKKHIKGKELLLTKIKRNYFSSKIEEMNLADFELLIRFFFEKEEYKNIIKKGRNMYLAEKEGYISCIKIFKLLEGIEVEKLDVRSLLTYMSSNNIRNGYIITTSTLSEEAKNLLDRFNDKIELKLIDIGGLQELADKHNMLPEDSFYYNKISYEKRKIDKKTVKNNILDIKQISLYIPASIFFFMTSIWLPENKLVIYIFYYFIILSIINIMFHITKKWQKTSK